MNKQQTCVALLLSSVTFFAQAAVPQSVQQTITQSLQQVRPELKINVVQESPVKGIYEVKVEQGPLLYVTADAKHFFSGALYQVEDKEFVNLYEQQLTLERKQLINAVPKSEMIVFKPEQTTKAVLNVFTDVDCGYCRKLHQEVPTLNAAGVEVRYLAFPRGGLQSAAFNKMATAWCSDNPQQVMTELKNNKTLPTKLCDNHPVAEHYALGQQVGVTGTPAILLEDGRLIPGYQSAENFIKLLGVE